MVLKNHHQFLSSKMSPSSTPCSQLTIHSKLTHAANWHQQWWGPHQCLKCKKFTTQPNELVQLIGLCIQLAPMLVRTFHQCLSAKRSLYSQFHPILLILSLCIQLSISLSILLGTKQSHWAKYSTKYQPHSEPNSQPIDHQQEIDPCSQLVSIVVGTPIKSTHRCLSTKMSAHITLSHVENMDDIMPHNL